jgi:hypothetical protein
MKSAPEGGRSGARLRLRRWLEGNNIGSRPDGLRAAGSEQSSRDTLIRPMHSVIPLVGLRGVSSLRE